MDLYPHFTSLPLTPQLHPSLSNHPISLFLHSHSQPSFHARRPSPGYVAVAMPGSQGQDLCYRLACANPACIRDVFERSHSWQWTVCPHSSYTDFYHRGLMCLNDYQWAKIPVLEKWPSICMTSSPCASGFHNVVCLRMKFKSLLVHVVPACTHTHAPVH